MEEKIYENVFDRPELVKPASGPQVAMFNNHSQYFKSAYRIYKTRTTGVPLKLLGTVKYEYDGVSYYVYKRDDSDRLILLHIKDGKIAKVRIETYDTYKGHIFIDAIACDDYINVSGSMYYRDKYIGESWASDDIVKLGKGIVRVDRFTESDYYKDGVLIGQGVKLRIYDPDKLLVLNDIRKYFTNTINSYYCYLNGKPYLIDRYNIRSLEKLSLAELAAVRDQLTKYVGMLTLAGCTVVSYNVHRIISLGLSQVSHERDSNVKRIIVYPDAIICYICNYIIDLAASYEYDYVEYMTPTTYSYRTTKRMLFKNVNQELLKTVLNLRRLPNLTALLDDVACMQWAPYADILEVGARK